MSVREEIGDERYARALGAWRSYCGSRKGWSSTHTVCRRAKPVSR